MGIAGYTLDGRPNPRTAWGIWVTHQDGGEGWAMLWSVQGEASPSDGLVDSVQQTAFIFTPTRHEIQPFVERVRQQPFIRSAEPRKMVLPVPVGWQLPEHLEGKFPCKA